MKSLVEANATKKCFPRELVNFMLKVLPTTLRRWEINMNKAKHYFTLCMLQRIGFNFLSHKDYKIVIINLEWVISNKFQDRYLVGFLLDVKIFDVCSQPKITKFLLSRLI
jgi:hypothetical protein